MADYSSFFDTLGQGVNLLGQLQGMGNANNTNQQVQQTLGQNSQALAQQIAQLQQGFQQGGQQAQDAYNTAKGLYDSQNQQLQGNIDTMTGSLNALSDPNSAYMRMARQNLERKDAAAGRRSQWGEREVQLQAMLADYIGKYSPGLNNSITSARNQMTANNNSLAGMYAQMQNAANEQARIAAQTAQAQQQLAQAQNTTGRTAANAATNNQTAALQAALGIGKGLYGMFGGGGGGIAGDTGQSYYSIGGNGDYGYNPFGQSDGITGWGGGTLGGYDTQTGANNYLGGSGNLFGSYDNYGGIGDDVWNF